MARSGPVQGVVLALMSVAMLWVLAERWDEVGPELHHFAIGELASATALALAAAAVTASMWWVVLADLGDKPSLPHTIRLYGLTLPAKYLPGSFWSVAMQAEIATRVGISRRHGLVSSAVGTLVGLVTAVGVGAALMPFSGTPGALDGFSGSQVVLAVVGTLLATVLLVPKVLNRILTRLVGPTDVSAAAVVRCIGLGIANWLLLGAHLAVLARPYDGSPGMALFCVGVFTASWVVGFLAVVAPAGAGARDATLVVLLSGAVPTEQALAMALASRTILVVSDGIGALFGLTAIRSGLAGRARSS